MKKAGPPNFKQSLISKDMTARMLGRKYKICFWPRQEGTTVTW